MKIYFNFALIVILFTCGCAQQPNTLPKKILNAPALHINSSLFEVNTLVDNSSLLFKLTDKQKHFFLQDYHRRIEQGIKPHQALADFMTNRLDGFTYHGETYNASTALSLQQGNCMSLAMITTALAKLVGLEFEFKHVSSEPVYDKQNGFILVSSHVQTKIFDPTYQPQQGSFTFIRPSIIIDYFPSSTNIRGHSLQEPTFIAKYYVNLAAEQLVSGNLDHAFHLASMALKHDSTHSGAINILAVLHKKKGDVVSAEKLYQAGLFYDKHNVRLLSNYIVLLESLNRKRDVQLQQTILDKLDDPNPYAWLEQAYVAQTKNQPRQAIRYYKKALDIAPYLQPAYQGLYQVYVDNERNQDAKNIIKQALNWSYEPGERKQYKFKLYQLKHQD